MQITYLIDNVNRGGLYRLWFDVGVVMLFFFFSWLTMNVWFFNGIASKVVINNVSNVPPKFDFNMMKHINCAGWIVAPTGLNVLLCKCLLNNKLTFIQMFYCVVFLERETCDGFVE